MHPQPPPQQGIIQANDDEGPPTEVATVATLLLTDVVDSTQLTRRLGDAAAARIWAEHDRVARDLLPQWQGREIDKSDGLLLLFDNPQQALGYAQAYLQSLSVLDPPLSARVGIHVGPVILRRNPADDVARGAKPLEVEGLAKPIVARMLSLAAAGWTLLSAQAAQVLTMADGRLSVRSLGHWRFKGLDEPLEVLAPLQPMPPHRHLPASEEEPTDSDKAHRVVLRRGEWIPARDIPDTLPEWPGAFIGRTQERQDAMNALNEHRLVTLMGMGGMGKTRLATHVAKARLHLHPDGLWFVDLSTLRDPKLLDDAWADAIGLASQPGRSLQQALREEWRERQALVVLDNCEHLVDAVADLVHRVLRNTAEVRILATSRLALGVPGETTLPVVPLAVPADALDSDDPMRIPACELFIRRAMQARPALTLIDQDLQRVAAIVDRLEGIPLAIELAAARARSMSIADIQNRLDDRYRLLTGGARVAHPRQQTLRALVDWSHSLLQFREQGVLRRLSVFEGGFDLEAAEVLCAGGDIDALDIADALSALVDHSLLQLEQRSDRSRYRLLETLREYGLEQLEAAAERIDLQRQHAEYFFEVVKRASRGDMGSPGQATVWLRDNLDNIRAAIRLSLSGGADPLLAVKYASFLQGFWVQQGLAAEGRRVVELALNLPEVQRSDTARSFCLYVSACLAGEQGEHDVARDLLQRCLSLRRQLGRPAEVAAALSTLGLELAALGDRQSAIDHEREALAYFTAVGDDIGQIIGHLHIGQYLLPDEPPTAAREALNQAWALADGQGHTALAAAACLWLAEVDMAERRLESAQAYLDRAESLADQVGDRTRRARVEGARAHLALLSGQAETARDRLSAVLPIFLSLGLKDDLLTALDDVVACLGFFATVADSSPVDAITAGVTRWRRLLGLHAIRRPVHPAGAQNAAKNHAAATASDSLPSLESLTAHALVLLRR